MLNVAIAVDSAVDQGPHAAQVVSAACEEVIGQARCPLASGLQPGTVAAWYAIVHAKDGALSSVRIEFRDRTADGVLIEERALTFSENDSRESRLASAGSVIAALVAAREGSLARPPLRSPAPRETARWGLELGALFAPGIADGPTRWGGHGRALFDLVGPLSAVATARYALHGGQPDLSWWTLSAGGVARLGERAVHLEVSGEAVFQRTRVEATRGAISQAAGQNGWGGRVGMNAVWAAGRQWLVVVGVDGTFVRPRIDVVVAGQQAASVPPLSANVLLGLRFQP